MSTPRRRYYREKIANPNQRKRLIGRFFQELTLMLLGGQEPRHRGPKKGLGDVWHGKLDAFVEVKASNANGKMKIFLCQLKAYHSLIQSDIAFPYSNCFYVLFSYKNRTYKKRRGINLIDRSTPTRTVLNWFLATKTCGAYIIDIEIIERLQRICGTTVYPRDFREEKIIPINRSTLKRLERPTAELFEWLDVPANNGLSVEHRLVECVFRENRMSFPISLVLKRELMPQVMNLLRYRRGFHLRPAPSP